MSAPKVLIYGGSGYTGKLIAESLADRGIPFYFAGRTRSKLEDAIKIVEERHGNVGRHRNRPGIVGWGRCSGSRDPRRCRTGRRG